jgi:aminomethyltransferase
VFASVDGAEQEVGTVTSGALSPTLGVPIALAYVSPRAAATGTVLHVDVRGTRLPVTVTTLPFYRRTPLTPRKDG